MPGTGYVASATAVAGPLTAALLNSYKNNDDSGANPARWDIQQVTTAKTIASSTSTWTTVDFVDAAGITADTVNGHSTSTNSSRYTAQAGWAGNYKLTASVAFTGNATGLRLVGFAVNGLTPFTQRGFLTVPNSGIFTVEINDEVFLNVGDYVQLIALQSSGSGLATVVSAPSGATKFVGRWVGAS